MAGFTVGMQDLPVANAVGPIIGDQQAGVAGTDLGAYLRVKVVAGVLQLAGAADAEVGVTIAAQSAGKVAEYSPVGNDDWPWFTASDVIAAGAEFQRAANGKIAPLTSGPAIGKLDWRNAAAVDGDKVRGRFYSNTAAKGDTGAAGADGGYPAISVIHAGAMSDGATVTLNFGKALTGRKITPRAVIVYNAGATLATAQLKFASGTATAAFSLGDGVPTTCTTFTDTTAAAGEEITVVLATGNTTGALAAGAQVIFVYSEGAA